MAEIKHPDVAVKLTGGDGNAMVVMGKVSSALRKAGYADEVNEFMGEAMSGDYDNLLSTCMRWVDVS